MKVYIAGPYTTGDIAVNIATAIGTGDRVRDLGHTPFIPHLAHFWHLLFPRTWIDWLNYDLVWLAQCDVVLRLPGESEGADLECKVAKHQGIPVFESWDAFVEGIGDANADLTTDIPIPV